MSAAGTPGGVNLARSIDFDMDTLATVRRIKCRTCVDDFIKECLTIITAFGISCAQVTHIPDSIALFRDYPVTIRTDQGLKFTCHPMDHWAFLPGVSYAQTSRASQCRTDLLRVLTDNFAMNF